MINVVRMEREHLPYVAALEAQSFSAPWSEKSLAAELENPLAIWLVALDGDRVVGYVGSQTVMEETDLMDVAVDPAYRRQGVAKLMLTALCMDLRARGSHSLSLEVRPSNAAALALYEKLSFYEIGRRKNYYQDPKEDALILKKEWVV